MPQELSPSDVTITVSYSDSNLEIENCVEGCLVDAIQAAVDAGRTGWVDLRVEVKAFGFTGEALLSAVTYRTAYKSEDLGQTVKDNGLVGDAVLDLIEIAKQGGWSITKQAGTVNEILDEVKFRFLRYE